MLAKTMTSRSVGGLAAALAVMWAADLAAQDSAPDRGAQSTNSTPGNVPGTNSISGSRATRGGGFGRGPQPAGPTTPFGTPGIELKPFVMDHRHAADSLIDLSFLLDAPAGKNGFLRAKGAHLVAGDGKPIRLWGFNITEWSRGSVEIPPKEDATMWASALARSGANIVRLQFLDLAAPRGLLDGTRDDSQHFDPSQLENEDYFLAEVIKRGIYVDFNLNVGRVFKTGDHVPVTREGKGPLLFDPRLIELEKDYARQLLTHVNPYTKKAYVDDPGIAIVEIVNEDAIYIGWSANNPYDQELTDLFNSWLVKNISPSKLAEFRMMAGVGPNDPVPRLKGPALRTATKDRYYTECRFFSDLEAGFFRDMSAYLRQTLGVKCPLIATADHSHSGSGYGLEQDAQQLDIMDDPFNSTVAELSRTAMAGKPYTVSEVNHPFPNQFACEGIPILAAYGGFLDWDGIIWYTFEPKRSPGWKPVLSEPFDMSHDPVKMTQMAAGALMFLRGDLERAKETVARSYTWEEVADSKLLAGANRPYFTPGFPMSVPLLHGSRVASFDGKPAAPAEANLAGPYQSDTGQLVWSTSSNETGLVTIDSPRSQALVGYVKANGKRVSNLSADVSNDFCAIVLNSLDASPISETSRLLLTTGSRVENTGLVWNAGQSRAADGGRSPTLIEPVTGTITLRDLAGPKRVSAKALDGSGHPIGDPIIAKHTGTKWEIAVGAIVTPWYEVTVER
jgi:hypothetical protein